MKNTTTSLLPLSALLASLVAVASFGRADSWPPPSELPDGILATIDGKPLSADDFHRRIVDELGSSADAAGVLQQLVDTRLIASEMKKRGLQVTEAEIDRKFDALAEQIREQSGGQTSLTEALEAQGVAVELFREQLEFLVGLEELARADFGIADEEEIPEPKSNLWLAQLRETSGLKADGLPDGVAVQTSSFEVTNVELGEALARLETAEYLSKLLRAMVSERLIQSELDALEIEITDADLEAEMEYRRWAFDRVERYAGVGFEQYLEATQGMSPDILRKTENYRYQVALKKIIERTVPEADRHARFEENIRQYGPLRRVRHLLIATKARTEKEAIERFDRIRTELHAGVPFTSLIKQYSEASDRMQGGDTGYFAATGNLDPAFVDAAFLLKPGDVSAPVRTVRGIEMIQLVGVKPVPPFDKADGMIRRDMALEWLDRKRKSSNVKPSWLFRSTAAPEEEG